MTGTPTYLNQLNQLTTLQGGYLFPLFAGNYGITATSSITVLQNYMQENLDFSSSSSIPQYITQYAAPSSTGFSVTISNGVIGSTQNDNVHLILTPGGTYATGTIILPPTPGAIDKQLVMVNCTQIVNTLTINRNGATAVTGAPSSLAVNSFFTLKYDAPTSTWYRVG